MATDILLAQVSDDTARLLFTLIPLALFLFTLIVFLLIVKSMYK